MGKYRIGGIIDIKEKDKISNKSSFKESYSISEGNLLSNLQLLKKIVKFYNFFSNKKVKFNNADIIHKYGFFIGLKTNKIEKTELEKFKDIFFNAFKKI